ncbi:hypothetical protein AYO49_05400 [Verrucomicrobiaceae bacterium SCGC AG-212-N21]|nr:hypothetical protein AYO49_05400 [Verrucomicrobiaceae bacterium SCGC AG-212-N21]
MNSSKSHFGAWILAGLFAIAFYFASIAPFFCLVTNANPTRSKLPTWFWTYGTPYRWVCETLPAAQGVANSYMEWWRGMTTRPDVLMYK